jgi:hypothetical protein
MVEEASDEAPGGWTGRQGLALGKERTNVMPHNFQVRPWKAIGVASSQYFLDRSPRTCTEYVLSWLGSRPCALPLPA